MTGKARSAPSEDVSSPQPSAARSDIRGDYSGNSGSNNLMNSGNTNSGNLTYNYFSDPNSPGSDAEILQCLYTSKYESHRNRIPKPADGTCVWVTEHPKYKDWLGEQSSALLWLSADPGCGKSVTASFLVTHLKSNTNAIICYFFFKDDSEEQKSAIFALSAILHQLFSQKNSLCRYAEKPFNDKGKGFAEELDTLWGILVEAVADEECGEVICVVDALDECEEVSLTELIRCLTSLPASETPDIPLKFLLTGRPYHGIERKLDLPATMIRLRGEDEVNAIRDDVARVINEGIENLESYWQLPGKLGYLRTRLESTAGTTFLWVSLVLEILKESADGSRQVFTNLVSNAPRDLAALYSRILDKSKDPNQARRILHIVVAATRPLTLQEINIAFRIRRDYTTIEDIGDISPRSEAMVKNLCGLFVRIIDSKVYLVHQTAKEFLIKGSLPGSGNWQYTLCPIDSSFILADICISYLSLQEFETDPLVMETAGIPETEAVQNYVQKYGLMDYAALHWAVHLRDSKDRQAELLEFSTAICDPSSKKFQTWFRVYWETTGQPVHHPFPSDFTPLMVASWFGQESLVKRLLGHRESINNRSEIYGTALNIAALRRDKEITGMLVAGRVIVHINRKQFKIPQTRKSELAKENDWRRYYDDDKGNDFREQEWEREWREIEFLLPFCGGGILPISTSLCPSFK